MFKDIRFSIRSLRKRRLSVVQSRGFGPKSGRPMLVMAQAGVVLVFLIGAALMIQSFIRLQSVKTVDPINTGSGEFSMPANRYNRAQRPGILAQMLERMQLTSGVI